VNWTTTTFLLSIAFAFGLPLVGCDESTTDTDSQTAVERPVEMQPFEIPETEDILGGDVRVTDLRLDQPERYLSCFEFFEPVGSVVGDFPFENDVRAQRVLWGCGIEAYQVQGDTRWVAYAMPIDPKTTTRNLKVVKYVGGKLAWTHRIDRSEQGRNFVANFRQSFITPLGNLTCVGTMWEGGTQTHCLDDKTGKPEWEGWMPFWAGFAPRAGEDGLWVADLMAMTKRYPFTGVEMAYAKLPDTGGRAALYATDGEALYFSPSRATPPTLTALEFGTMSTRWKRELPKKPIPSFSETFPKERLLVIVIDQALVGVDTETGKPLWAWDIGDDRPSITLHDDVLLVLHRRPERPNAVVALEPRSGKRIWRAELPSGILEVKSAAGELFFKSIRAIQKVTGGLEFRE
jgi:hypothetical protein